MSCQVYAYKRNDGKFEQIDALYTSAVSREVMASIESCLTIEEIKSCCDSDGWYVLSYKEEFVKRADEQLPDFNEEVQQTVREFIRNAARNNAYISCSH